MSSSNSPPTESEHFRDLALDGCAAELVSCIADFPGTAESGSRLVNIWSCLRILREDVKSEGSNFRYMTERPVRLDTNGEPKFLVITQSIMSVGEAMQFLDFQDEYLDPSAPAPARPVLSEGKWVDARICGSGTDQSIAGMLPPLPMIQLVHEKWGDGNRIRSRFTDKEWARTIQTLAEVLGVDFERHSDRVGNLIVVAPDFGLQVDCAFRTDPPRMGLEIIEQSQRGARDYWATLSEVSNGSKRYSRAWKVTTGLNAIRLDVDPRHYELEIYDQETGRLRHTESHRLLHDLSIQLGMVGNKNTVVVDGVEAEYRWDTPLGQKNEIAATPAAEEAIAAQRHSESLLEQQGRMFFYEGSQADRTRAVEDVRNVIRKQAETSLGIWDPYFSWQELIEFVTALSRPSITVRVLTKNRSVAEKISEVIQSCNEQAQIGGGWRLDDCEVRVSRMRDHDRFVLTDKACWQLGTSLNSLGESISSVLEFPNPARIRTLFQRAWNRAERV